MATTYAYALERIYECLVEGAGARYALSSPQRFVRGYPPGVRAATLAERSLATPSCYVTIADQAADRLPTSELVSSQLYGVTFHIWRYYYLGHNEVADELDTQQVRALDDFPRIRALLCWPGNLTETAESNPTGLDSHALDGFSARSELQSEAALGDDARLLKYRDTFLASFSFEPTP